MREDLPRGTVTFLFTDVENSTKLLHEFGAEAYAEALAEHRRLIRGACARNGGVEVDTQGDAFFLAFPTAPGALEAAREIVQGLSIGPVHVRMGLHTGTPLVTEEGYVGPDVHRAARIAAVGHAGQVLLSSSTAALVGTTGLRDLGEQRLKDLSAPERVFQLGTGVFPSLRSLHRTNLPVPATPFLGREHELAEVVELISRDETRLLTLTGPGGTGKTRLALQAAAQASERFPDGITWVALAPLRDASLVLAAVAQTLGVSEEPGKQLAETLGHVLTGKRALVLFDNAEHLLPAVAEELVPLIGIGPVLLVTSRERLQLEGELLYPVPTLTESDGTALFLSRARALDPKFEGNGTVRELCARLDNLPLALELAAARTTVFSPQQLLERLSERLDLLKAGRSVHARQQTLRAAIEWSHDLLNPDEQRLFRCLSAFAGGCTYKAAEEVCGADPDTLQSLIDKSLLRRRAAELGPRYWMLETIREYAAERLDESGDATALRLRCAEWLCELAERLVGMPPQRLLDDSFGAFPDEYANVRSALAWAWANGHDELGLRFGPACVRYWMSGGLFRDATSWLEAARAGIPTASPRVALRALKAAGVIAFWVLADTKQADAHWAHALTLAEQSGDADEIAWVERMRAGVAWESGDLERALALQEQNLAKARASGNRVREADTLHLLGEVLRDLGRLEEAEVTLLEAGAAYRERGAERMLALNAHSLADLALDRGDLAKAARLYRESLELDLRHGGAHEGRDIAYCLAGLASVLAERGRDAEASTLWGAVCAAEDGLGFKMIGAERRRYEMRLTRFENTPAWTAGRELTLEKAQAFSAAAF